MYYSIHPCSTIVSKGEWVKNGHSLSPRRGSRFRSSLATNACSSQAEAEQLGHGGRRRDGLRTEMRRTGHTSSSATAVRRP